MGNYLPSPVQSEIRDRLVASYRQPLILRVADIQAAAHVLTELVTHIPDRLTCPHCHGADYDWSQRIPECPVCGGLTHKEWVTALIGSELPSWIATRVLNPDSLWSGPGVDMQGASFRDGEVGRHK